MPPPASRRGGEEEPHASRNQEEGKGHRCQTERSGDSEGSEGGPHYHRPAQGRQEELGGSRLVSVDEDAPREFRVVRRRPPLGSSRRRQKREKVFVLAGEPDVHNRDLPGMRFERL